MDSARYDVQSDLRFFLPLKVGQRIAIIGAKPSLLNTAQNDGLEVIEPVLSKDSIALETASMDHVIAADPGVSSSVVMFREYARILKKGGFLLLGVSNAASVQFFFRKVRAVMKHKRGMTLQRAAAALKGAGLSLQGSYGIQTSLCEPSFMVPLERPYPSNYYFTNVFVPYSLLSVLGRQAAFLLISLGLQQLLFADLGLVARRI